MPEPWTCPRCQTVNAPWSAQCSCTPQTIGSARLVCQACGKNPCERTSTGRGNGFVRWIGLFRS